MLPGEIQAKTFTHVVRGFKEDEVTEFLDEIAADFAALTEENDRLRLKIEDLNRTVEDQNQKIEEYKLKDSTMFSTLEAAKSLMSDISASAEKRAEILIKNAELDAELKEKQANEAVQRLKDEEQSLSERVNLIRSRFRNLLEAELARFDSLSGELFSELPSAELFDHSDEMNGAANTDDSFLDELDLTDAQSKSSVSSATLTNIRR